MVHVTVIKCVRWCVFSAAVLCCMLLGCMQQYSRIVDVVGAAVLPACCLA